jgi:hypothetical protein
MADRQRIVIAAPRSDMVLASTAPVLPANAAGVAVGLLGLLITVGWLAVLFR